MIGTEDILNAGILIVDDSAVNVLLLERMLAAAGYTTVTSTTDPTAVRALHLSNRYDLILLDVMMPVMDGFDVLAAVSEIEAGGYAPVLMLTAQPEHKHRALAGGARDFISKPFDQAEVLSRIHNALEVRLLLKESRSYNKLLEQFDQLTGLPNRRRLCTMIDAALARDEAPNEIISLVFVSVDRFKVVSDVLGRSIGGALLTSVADRLVACLGPMTTIARLEAADFGVLLVHEKGDLGATAEVAERMHDVLRQAVEIEGHALSVTASIGIAVSPTDASRADDLLACASRALDEARTAGGNMTRFYSSATNDRAAARLEKEIALRGALDRNEYVIVYQPKMSIATGEWSSAEALLRWVRPAVGTVSPAEFIPILESTGMIVPVGMWVIESVCEQIAQWARLGLGSIRVAVNVSGRQFADPAFVGQVEAAIARHAIPPATLDIEITESSLMSRDEATDAVLRALKKFGVSIAIDDFGTGYSSLSYLKRYPIDALKIDISFVRELTTSEDGAAIALTIINMARVLKMKVIAEGVETQAQLDFLREHACDEIQGYLFSKPLPALELTQWRQSQMAVRILAESTSSALTAPE